MKTHQRRFQEALKRLDREVQNKANLGLYSRSKANLTPLQGLPKVQSTSDLTIPLKIQPPSSPLMNKSRFVRFKKSKEDENIEENQKGQKLEKANSANPHALESLLKFPEGSPLIDSPHEIDTVLKWKDRNILDYSKVEDELKKQTLRYHQLITKNFCTNTDDNYILPIDFFDCRNNEPEDETRIRNNEPNFTARGATKLRYGEEEVEWTPCTILRFDPKGFTFTVVVDNRFSAFDNTQMLIKEVSRSNLRFDGENLDDLEKRFKLAETLRSEYEQNLKTITFLDTVEFLPNTMNFISEDIKNILPNDALKELYRTQKMQIIRGSLKLEANDQMENLIKKLNVNINAYSPTPIKEDFHVSTNFTKSLNRIKNRPDFLSINGFVRFQQSFHSLCLDYKDNFEQYFYNYFSNNLLPLSEWETKIKDFQDYQMNFMFQFIDQIVKNINQKVGYILDDDSNLEELKTFRKINERPFLQFFVSDDKTLFNRLRRMIPIFLRQFAFELLDMNLRFFLNLIDYEYPEIKLEEINNENFSTLSSKCSEQSITSKKPLIVIDLSSDKEKMRKVIFDHYCILNNVLKTLVNPFAALFEKSEAKTLLDTKHSRFEPFLLSYDLNKYQPRSLIFVDNDIDEYFNKLTLRFNDSLNYNFEQSTKILPEIQAISNNMILHFKREDFPTVEETYEILTKLDADKMFFIENFPQKINIGIFQISFSDFQNYIVQSVQQYRINSLNSISDTLVEKMMKLHSEYANLSSKLKQEVQTQEQWNSLQDILDSVLGIRENLEKDSININSLYDLLFSLYYGLDAQALVKYLNIQMWPILIDMELGQSLAKSIRAKKVFLSNNPESIKQLQNEVDSLEKSIKLEKNPDAQLKQQNYKVHLMQKIVRIEELTYRMQQTTQNSFKSPRVQLWCVATLSQASIEEWQDVPIGQLDLNNLKETIKDYLNRLRVLTRSLRGDTNSLRLLISTKNDLEHILPLFRICAQILSPKLKENYKNKIIELLGTDKFAELSLKELKNNANLGENAPEILKICAQSKSEDKTDVELINCENIVHNHQVTINQLSITNIEQSIKILRDQKVILTNIQSHQKLPPQKLEASQSLVTAIEQMIEVLDLLHVIQDLVLVLSPLKTVSSIKDQAKEITSAISLFNEQVSYLQKNPTLISYATKRINIVHLQNIRTRLKAIHSNLIALISEMRTQNPRLIFVPDSRILSIFADDITIKGKILSIMFPGIKSWVTDNNNQLTAITLYYDDILLLSEPIPMSESIFSLIPKLENSLTNAMKSAFFENDNIVNMPIQLCFLKIMINPDIKIDSTKINIQKFKILSIFQQSIKESQNSIKITTNQNSRQIILSAGEGQINYGFQISHSRSLLFSPSLISAIYDIINLHASGEQILINANNYSLSSILIQIFSFLTGRPCYIIHPTLFTPISRLSKIISNLYDLNINSCIDEAEIFSMRQDFEISMLIKTPFYCALTSNTIPPVLCCGKKSYSIQSSLIKSHLDYIGHSLFTNSSNQIDFVTKTLTQYIHSVPISNYFEQCFLQGDDSLNLNFVSNFQMIIPPEVYEESLPDILNSPELLSKKHLNIGKSILSTTDFLSGVEVLAAEFKKGTQVLMVSGPQFSGITTCIQAASQSCNIPCISIAFSSQNWIHDVMDSLRNIDNKRLILHILLPFDKFFIAHSSSLLLKGFICEGTNSLMCVRSKITIVFEMMTQITSAIQIPIPIFTFSTPLIKTSELIVYWMLSSNIQISFDDKEFIQVIVSKIISSSLQLFIFYTLFSALLEQFPTFNHDSLSIMIGYCAFWSKVNEFTKIEQWKEYSDVVKSNISQFQDFTLDLYEYIFSSPEPNSIFELKIIYKNPKTMTFDETQISQYSEFHCGNIALTNIPTSQFITCIMQLPLIIRKGKSVILIGQPGSGKSTIVRYISAQFFYEPHYKVLNFDGKTLTDEELLKHLTSISVITVDGVIQPKDEAICVVIIDPFSSKDQTYGSILSIIKTGNAIINTKIVSFRRFQFILCLEEYDYQLATCSFPLSIKPYSEQDLVFLAQETTTRILLKRGLTTSQVSKINTGINQIVKIITPIMLGNNDFRYLHFFLRVIRSVENLPSNQSIDIVNFIKWRISFILPHSFELPFDVNQPYVLALPDNNNHESKPYCYVPKARDRELFEEAISPFVHLFLYNVQINEYSLEYISFVVDTVLSANAHAMIVNDLNLDYEMLTQFAASTISAQYIVYQSPQQMPIIIRDSISSPQPIILFCREPDKFLLSLIKRGFKTSDISYILDCLNDSSVNEKIDYVKTNKCNFPYATFHEYKIAANNNQFKNESSSTFLFEIDPSETVSQRIKASDFYFFQLHLFRNLHIFFNVKIEDEINKNTRDLLNIWNMSDKIPQTDNNNIQHLFSLMMLYREKSYVKMIHQLPKVIQRYNFIIDRVEKYTAQRKMFVQQIIVVIKAIETSILDTSDLITSTKRQIEMDETFLTTHTQAVEYRQNIVTNLSGDLARNRAELDQINKKNNEYNEYKQKDSSKTGAAVDIATKAVVKAFTQEEQYKLYIQQNPSAAVRHLFNTYCILREFTPREDNDYWPEARVLLKSGRFHRTITVFDKNNIKKNVILQFDVMMNSPLIKPENFPNNSACKALANWIQAVHKHTQSTSFNTTVSHEMLELLKSKSRKEKEIEEIEVKLKAAKEDLAKHEKSLLELKDKIKQENLLLANVSKYNEMAAQISQCFPLVKSELSKFSHGEKKQGQNMKAFAFIETVKSTVYPLFPQKSRKDFENEIAELEKNIGFNSKFFVPLHEIIGSDDPLVLSLLSGDRLIAIFDPNGTEFDILINNPLIPSFVKFEFVITAPLSHTFEQDVINSAEKGKVLVIRHADEIIYNPFFSSIVSKSVMSSNFNRKLINIDSEFRTIFILDRPPKDISAHMTFISCLNLQREKLESILINNNAPIDTAKKRMNSEANLRSQLENLYISLDKLSTELSRIHSSDTSVLNDALLQCQLLQNALQAVNYSKIMSDHVLDGFEWVKPVTDEILGFLQKIQNLYTISPLYLWPFSKLVDQISDISGKNAQLINILYQRVSSAILKKHQWGIDELKFSKSADFESQKSKLNILHYTDIFLAVNFLQNRYNRAKVTNGQIVEYENFSIEKDTSLDMNLIKNLLKNNGKEIIFTFFDQNMSVAQDIDRIISESPPSTWHEKSKIFILTETSFDMPPHIVLTFRVFALE